MTESTGAQKNTAYGVFVQACWAQHKRQYPDELILTAQGEALDIADARSLLEQVVEWAEGLSTLHSHEFPSLPAVGAEFLPNRQQVETDLRMDNHSGYIHTLVNQPFPTP